MRDDHRVETGPEQGLGVGEGIPAGEQTHDGQPRPDDVKLIAQRFAEGLRCVRVVGRAEDHEGLMGDHLGPTPKFDAGERLVDHLVGHRPVEEGLGCGDGEQRCTGHPRPEGRYEHLRVDSPLGAQLRLVPSDGHQVAIDAQAVAHPDSSRRTSASITAAKSSLIGPSTRVASGRTMPALAVATACSQPAPPG